MKRKHSLIIGLCSVLLLSTTTQKLHGYSFQFQTLLLLDLQAGLGNFAAADRTETPERFAFSGEFGLKRFGIMPQIDAAALFIMRSRYLLRFQAILNNLRSQQSNFAFGLGNENIGLLIGLAQGLSLSSHSRENLPSFGLYAKTFYNPQGIMDLQFEAAILTNTLSNTNSKGQRNIYLYLQALFLISQLRIGIIGIADVFQAVATGPNMFHIQGKLLLGGVGPARFFSMDFYFSSALLLNQGLKDTNYALLSFGFGFKLWLTAMPRSKIALFLEAIPLGLPLEKVEAVHSASLALTVGLHLKLRLSRKEIWSPEQIVR